MAAASFEPEQAPLPIDEHLPALSKALRRGANAVLVAPPGAGKTTRVPLALLAEPWAAGQRLILLEPRRLAARAAAERMAALLGEEVGGTVGLRMRLGSRIGPRTCIEVVTEGVFTRLILDDPALEGVAAVIFDEFHERSLDADFGLALALEAQIGLRPELRLVAMSATLDGARVAALMGGAPLLVSEGRGFPIETRHAPRDPALRLDEAAARVALRALREERGGVLVFLPGQGEIARVAARLREVLAVDDGIDIVPLHGGLDLAGQQLALRPSPAGRRKLVLATAIAETSITIPDIRVVIDGGLARVPVYEPDIGVTRLETVRVSRAAADQRRGRAGRTAPGICYRLWEAAATQALPAFPAPEILNADLTGLVLDCAAWGAPDPAALPFLDQPPAGALAEARKLAAALGALDADGRLTEDGRAIRALPLPPRLARMLIDAARLGAGKDAAMIAAIAVERGFGGGSADLAERLEAAARDRSPRGEALRRLAATWARQAQAAAPKAVVANGSAPPAEVSPGLLLALAYPERIAKARGAAGAYLLANGRAASLDAADALARQPYLAVAEIAGRAGAARILLAAAIAPAEIERHFRERILGSDETSFEPRSASVRKRRQRRLGAILLDDAPLAVDAGEETAAALARGIADLGLTRLPWTREIELWRGRVAFLRRSQGEAWPDLSDAALAAGAENWLAPHLLGKTSLGQISADDLRQALEALLSWDLPRRLDAQAPAHFEAPSGSRLPIAYAEAGASVSVRVQELFGLAAHPSVAGGRVPLTLRLLSPAHRPIQITTDLPGFWRGSWAEVRAQMRGRYPKHAWPEDPLAEAPTSRAKPRK